jgi:hypothetical protein
MGGLPACLRHIPTLVFIGEGIRSSHNRMASDSHATTAASDLAKSVFLIAVANKHWRTKETQRCTHSQFERWFASPAVSLVIMEACGLPTGRFGQPTRSRLLRPTRRQAAFWKKRMAGQKHHLRTLCHPWLIGSA